VGILSRRLRAVLASLRSDRAVVERQFRRAYGRPLDLGHPVTFDEKLQWYKLYYRRRIMGQLADKYAVRRYVADKGHGHILNELYGVYRHAEDVPFDALPDSFVLKATHGSGFTIICRDKAALDAKAARAKLRRWLATDYYLFGREWAYRDVPRAIVCERYLENEERGELVDYKFYCYGGVPQVVFACSGRFSPGGLRYDAFDMGWNLIPAWKGKPGTGLGLPPPPGFEAMKAIARDLSHGFPFLRVDLYSIEGRAVFGELTFYPDSGLVPFTPVHYNRFFGDLLLLPERPVIEPRPARGVSPVAPEPDLAR